MGWYLGLEITLIAAFGLALSTAASTQISAQPPLVHQPDNQSLHSLSAHSFRLIERDALYSRIPTIAYSRTTANWDHYGIVLLCVLIG
jgi:hypothetical protein